MKSNPSIQFEDLKKIIISGFNKNKNTLNQNKQTKQIHNQIIAGNRQLYKKYVHIINDLLKQNNKKQIVYDSITQLLVSAVPTLIHDLNQDLLIKFQQNYQQNDNLDYYIMLWKQMYNGQVEKEVFPDLRKTFKNINIQVKKQQIPLKLNIYLEQYTKNILKIQQKKVQFFQDFQDSEITESFDNQSRMSQIIYMDILQIKGIRQKVQNQPLTQENCTQYLLKLKTFLNLNTSHLNTGLQTQFSKQKQWAKKFINNHKEYLNEKKTILDNPSSISLSKDQIHIQQSYFQKKNNMNKNRKSFNEQSIRNSRNLNVNLNQLPMNQSRFEQQQMINLPKMNKLKSQKVGSFNPQTLNKNLQNYQQVSPNRNVFSSNQVRSSLSFNPNQSLQKFSKNIPLKKPTVEQSFTINQQFTGEYQEDISIPKQTLMILQNRKTHLKSQKVQQIDYNQKSRNSFSSTNNPFKNSKTNYNPQIDQFQQNTLNNQYKIGKVIDPQNPIRKRMVEDDLDSENLEDIVVNSYKPNQPKLLNTQKLVQNEFYQTNGISTHKIKSEALSIADLNSYGYKTVSENLSPRSKQFNRSISGTKKRLSEFTSQKKLRKKIAPPKQELNQPEQYAFRPYSNHFDNIQDFNIFKKNCWIDNINLFKNEFIDITLQLRKLKDEKVQINVFYTNLIKDPLSLKVLYKIPKCFNIQKVSKIDRKFTLYDQQTHTFNLNIVQFPLQMCTLQLNYSSKNLRVKSQDILLCLPITIRNFTQILLTNKQQWLQLWTKLNKNDKQCFKVSKSFQIDRGVLDPVQLQSILCRQFINIGSIQGYSVQDFTSICYYRNLNNLMFLIRISIRVNHIVSIQIVSDNKTNQNQRDFINYYLQCLVMLLAKYNI